MVLQPHRSDGGARRSDECDAGAGTGVDEVRIFRQETVARMDALHPRLARHGNDLVDRQVTLARRRRPDVVRFVAGLHMQCTGVRVGEHGDRAHAEAFGGARHTHSNLTAIGDQHRREHAPLLHARTRAREGGRKVVRYCAAGRGVVALAGGAEADGAS
jgi:hypothetical protein